MDISGAQALSERIAQQRHWRQARAVQLGNQPASDPDGYALESFYGGVRTYRPQERIEFTAGRPTMVTRRVSKRLIDGVWEGEVVVLGTKTLPERKPRARARRVMIRERIEAAEVEPESIDDTLVDRLSIYTHGGHDLIPP